MTYNLKHVAAATIMVALVIVSFVVLSTPTHANPSQIEQSNYTATTTVSYMTGGTATTTYYYDTQTYGTGAADNAVLGIQFSASSTNSKLNLNLEYANNTPGVDCTVSPALCDWYANNLSDLATTTPGVNLVTVQTYVWQFASSTIGLGNAIATNQRDLKFISVKTPARYIRAVFTLSVGQTNGNGGVWASFIGKREQR